MKQSKIINEIKRKTEIGNIDNISRTVIYEGFYKKNPEIKWALLAGLVSRNAGWNMTDLKSKWFQQLITGPFSDLLFQTFERANWTIFADAYPQLLWYEFSKKQKHADFSLLKQLEVSEFMQKEWKWFWDFGDEERLCTSLIINEQFTIEEPVMKHPLYQKKVFSSLVYFLEEHAHMSYVIFPSMEKKIYGLYVRNFKKVKSRIWLGRQLQSLLFHPEIHDSIYQFCLATVPTGSRNDYEQYFRWSTGNTSPKLRETYPIVAHHWKKKIDWSQSVKKTECYFSNLRKIQPVDRTKWLQKKWIEIYLMQKVKGSL
ncbi:DUF2515 family protein [Halalkalibacter alkaliphilus]|uniref:DUF2515 domain-containing protein n=1 Tax=Halalkalibacter alkaliphilus TaxID=2917993 RepID=A0A9X2A3D5_9BACI|nr:DUF2515 family protein [Halalkalibacter alkaliphilus]MCL7745958.1 DUF2515 domain-containing protein [Halalkalibacter alkaliphilus]